MEKVLGRLQTLTPDQLREAVLGAGLNCGPVTATTRAIFERKLARALMEKEGDDAADKSKSFANAQSEAPPGDGGEGRDCGQSLKLDLSAEDTEGDKDTSPCGETEQSPSQSPLVYYGICPQREASSEIDEKVHVYVDRKKALKAFGRMNGARLKDFSTRVEAETFSKGMNELIITPISSPNGPQSTLESDDYIGVSPSNPEKANEFPCPRTQDLTAKLRRAVEKGDQAAFSKLVWDNPRYLVGCGDNPTIVHQGCHYNVLHVAAKENQPGIVQLVLEILENPEFMRLMYPDDQEAMLQRRIRYIIDLYLNTPDKTSNDTPLHFACKFGCPEVVNILCSHPTTDKHRKNKYNQKPSDMICERQNKTTGIRIKIKEYMEDRCYVPLFRDTDNSFQPVIGLPWSPSPLDFQPLGLGLEGNPIDPVLTVRAYVGPLSPSKAKEFYKLWRNPPRGQAKNFHNILKSDPGRGGECVGREIAHNMGHPWAEYWDFLDSFVDLSTEEGLNRLEVYLKKDNSVITQVNREADPPTSQRYLSSPTEKGKSPVCNLLPKFEEASLLEGVDPSGEQATAEDVEGFLATSAPETVGKGLNLANDSFWTLWGKSHCKQKKGEDELSSTCSEEYLTADEGSEYLDCPTDGRRDRKGSVSSCSSFQSSRDTTEDTALTPERPTSQQVFIEGESPTSFDREVLSALENVVINPEKYPFITKWKNTIHAYPSPQSWPVVYRKRATQTNWISLLCGSSPQGIKGHAS
ncbi:ankyrin repeat and LEM domain-containing protein 2-like [Polymixia lowei]